MVLYKVKKRVIRARVKLTSQSKGQGVRDVIGHFRSEEVFFCRYVRQSDKLELQGLMEKTPAQPAGERMAGFILLGRDNPVLELKLIGRNKRRDWRRG